MKAYPFNFQTKKRKIQAMKINKWRFAYVPACTVFILKPIPYKSFD